MKNYNPHKKNHRVYTFFRTDYMFEKVRSLFRKPVINPFNKFGKNKKGDIPPTAEDLEIRKKKFKKND